MQRLVVRGWLALTAATLAMLLLRNPYTGSGKFADAFDLAGLQAVLETKPGAALVSRLLLLGAAALFIAVLFGTYARREDELERKDLTFGLAVGGGVVATGIAATWAMSEHASTGIQANIAVPVDILHLLAVAAWLGGLVSLLVALYRTPEIGSGAVRRFSAVAFGSVVVLAATGIYQSWRQVGSWSAPTGTRYGQLLIVKVALIGVMLAVAWFSRRWTGRLTDPAVTASASRDAEETGAEGTGTEEAAAPAQDPEADPERAAQLARQPGRPDRDEEEADTGRRPGALRAAPLGAGRGRRRRRPAGRHHDADVHRAGPYGGGGRRRLPRGGRSGRRRRGQPEHAVRHRRPERQGHRPHRHRSRPHRLQRSARVDRRQRRQADGRPRAGSWRSPWRRRRSARCRSPRTGWPRGTGRRAGS
ncbi:hypothetical protein SCALM49S_04759 [Streptomyces californicus]